MVERQPSKLNVEGSSPFSRSVFIRLRGPNPNKGSGFVRDPSRRGLEPAPVWEHRMAGCSLSHAHAFAHLAQSVERVLGKDEVTSSILVVGSKPSLSGSPIHGPRKLDAHLTV